jgi:hypothetical protein
VQYIVCTCNTGRKHTVHIHRAYNIHM